MKLKYKFMIQKVGDHYMAVDVSGDKSDFKGIVKLNDTGKLIFEILRDDVSFDELVDKVTAEFQVDRAKVEAGVKEFIDAIKAKGLLVED